MILEVQNGCFGYPKQPVILENINLRLEEGHILAILGPNGIGKTTLLKCMIGLLPWHSGKTLFYGKDIHILKPKDVWSTMFRCWWMNCIIRGGRCAASFRLLCGRKLLYEQCSFYTFPGSPDPGCYDHFPTFRTGLWSAGNMVFLGRRHFYYPGIL